MDNAGSGVVGAFVLPRALFLVQLPAECQAPWSAGRSDCPCGGLINDWWTTLYYFIVLMIDDWLMMINDWWLINDDCQCWSCAELWSWKKLKRFNAVTMLCSKRQPGAIRNSYGSYGSHGCFCWINFQNASYVDVNWRKTHGVLTMVLRCLDPSPKRRFFVLRRCRWVVEIPSAISAGRCWHRLGWRNGLVWSCECVCVCLKIGYLMYLMYL